MMQPSLHSNRFILEAFDRDLWCPVAQTLFHATDIGTLREILGAPDGDPELRWRYHLDDEELAALAERFGVELDRALLESANIVMSLHRWHRVFEAPYLIHTGYELPLLLDGRKKLARMSEVYPPMTFNGEHRFDHWVAEGLLHKEENIEPFDTPSGKYLGHRTVFYTPKGEEWRIPACRLIWEASRKSGGWNEHFERLEGMLLGYEDWQNDWWIDVGLQGIVGPAFCCPVTSAGLAWIKAAGFRALPPVESPALMITHYDVDTKEELHSSMLKNPDHAAVVRFKVRHLREAEAVMDFQHEGLWHVQAERMGELNRHLLGSVVIVARRGHTETPQPPE